VFREIDLPLKNWRLIPCLSPLWRVVTWIQIYLLRIQFLELRNDESQGTIARTFQNGFSRFY